MNQHRNNRARLLHIDALALVCTEAYDRRIVVVRPSKREREIDFTPHSGSPRRDQSAIPVAKGQADERVHCVSCEPYKESKGREKSWMIDRWIDSIIPHFPKTHFG